MRCRSTLMYFVLPVFIGLLLSAFVFPATAYAASWWPFADDGLSGGYEAVQKRPSAMVVFGGNLYVSTSGGVNGCEVWRWDGSSLTQVVGQSPLGTSGTGPGFGNADNTGAPSMAVYSGNLYVGTENATTGCEVWRTSDGTAWEQVVGAGAVSKSGFGSAGNVSATSMCAFGSNIFVGTRNAAGLEVWAAFDGTSWFQSVGPAGTIGSGFGDTTNLAATSMAVFGTTPYLYVGTGKGSGGGGCEVWRSANGVNWSPVVGPVPAAIGDGFGDANNEAASSMAADGTTLLYVGTDRGWGPGACEVWQSGNGTAWSQIGNAGMTSPSNYIASSMAVYGGDLYVGTTGMTYWAEVIRYRGSVWERVDIDAMSQYIMGAGASSLASYGGNLYAGIDRNMWGGTLWRTAGAGGPPYTDWTRISGIGFAPNANEDVTSMATMGGNLYVGTGSYSGCELWRCDGSAWTALSDDGFGDSFNIEVASMIEFKGDIYAGTWKSMSGTGAEIWRTSGGACTRVDGGVLGTTNLSVSSMAVFGDYLYAGTGKLAPGCEVWRTSDGTTWTPVVGPAPATIGSGFGTLNGNVASLAVFGGYLYAGTENSWVTGCEVWRTSDGTTWTPVVGPAPATIGNGFGNAINLEASSMAVFAGGLYVGTDQDWGGGACEVWGSPDGTTWTRVDGGALGAANTIASSMYVYDARLWVGTENATGGCEVWSTAAAGGPPYTDWTLENAGGFGNANNLRASCMVDYYSGLKVGTGNVIDGCEIWSTDMAWYLAEGATAGGFETWVLVQNPGVDPVHVDFTLNTDTGEVKPPGLQGFAIPAGSRVSFNLGNEVNTYDVSTKVHPTDGNVICERAMYFTPAGAGQRVLGHDSIGVTAPASVWYLAEGATAGGFETWVLVQNPGPAPVHVDFTLNTDAGEVKPPDLQNVEIGAGTRSSFNLGNWAQTYDISTKVEATDGDVICERAMYFTPAGASDRVLGHDSIGVTAPASVWYLAEGATAGGFETWVLVQNPGPVPVHVDFTLNTDAGEVKPPGLQGFAIPAGSRVSFNIGNEVTTYDVSTKVEATDGQVICERAMYFTPAGASERVLGHDSIGFVP